MVPINPRLAVLVNTMKANKNNTMVIKPKILGRVIEGKPVLNSTGLIY